MSIFDRVKKYGDVMYKAERYIWENAEVGYKEYKTDAYMKKAFRDLGYEIKDAGNITGFSAEIDTGREGPTLALLAELDALYCASHPETNKETGAVHACGHNVQCASIIGVASVLKEEGALDNLSGKIRFIIVPAEEGVDIAPRSEMIKRGEISFVSGKPEMIKRGFFNGVDIAFMVHTANLSGKGNPPYHVSYGGSNGNIKKRIIIKGKAAHAGGNPSAGINAHNACSLMTNAINYLRETFEEKDKVRFHGIVVEGGSSVNVVPDRVVMECYVRASSIPVLVKVNAKINRAIACAVASVGATVEIVDIPGSEPVKNDKTLADVTVKIAKYIAGENACSTTCVQGGSSTDMGDVSSVFPSLHAYVGGIEGTAHGKDYKIKDSKKICLNSSSLQLGVVEELLKDGAKKAKEVIQNSKVEFKSVEEYLEHKESVRKVLTPVTIDGNGAKIKI